MQRFFPSSFLLRPSRDWFRKDDDVRWQWRETTWTTNGSPKGEHNLAHQYPSPQRGNANFAWVQHFIHHLAPHGMAGFVLANGSMSSNQSGEGTIRQALIEADLVDCMVALPGQLFYSTQIPVCLWFLAKNKTGGTSSGSSGLKRRNRKGAGMLHARESVRDAAAEAGDLADNGLYRHA